jgi:hypothetical protein
MNPFPLDFSAGERTPADGIGAGRLPKVLSSADAQASDPFSRLAKLRALGERLDGTGSVNAPQQE